MMHRWTQGWGWQGWCVRNCGMELGIFLKAGAIDRDPSHKQTSHSSNNLRTPSATAVGGAAAACACAGAGVCAAGMDVAGVPRNWTARGQRMARCGLKRVAFAEAKSIMYFTLCSASDAHSPAPPAHPDTLSNMIYTEPRALLATNATNMALPHPSSVHMASIRPSDTLLFSDYDSSRKRHIL